MAHSELLPPAKPCAQPMPQCRSLYPRPFVRPNGSLDSRGNERPGRGL